jgi:hypothetical protein
LAPACSASELFPEIDRIVCPESSVVTLVASSAICRNLCTRDDALSAFVCGGPVLLGASAALNAWVNRCFATSSGMPSRFATDAASELANDETTSVSGIPRSSCSRIFSSRALLTDAVEAAVDELAEILPAKSACSELLSVALKMAPLMEPADGVASVAPDSVVPDFVVGVGRRIVMGFRMSPPFAMK